MQLNYHTLATADRVPSEELPASPDDIDLDRVVHDPDYRRAVKDLLRRWGVGTPGTSGP